MWSEFQFNEPYIGDDVTEINDVKLPRSYMDFMKNIMAAKEVSGKLGYHCIALKNCNK